MITNVDLKTTYDKLLQLDNTSKEREILLELNKFGRAPKDFPFDIFINLLQHKNHKIRLLTVKHLGKFSNPLIIKKLIELFKIEKNTIVKREIVSSIGRKRSADNIPILLKFSQDEDPKIILQAIRGLLYFKNIPKVRRKLATLQKHKNETISHLLQIELNINPKKKIHNDFKFKQKYENEIVLGDIRDVLKKIPDEIFDLTFTSPPYYNAKDYTIYKSYEEYLTFLEEVFREIHRTTAEGRFFILNTSPVILPRVSRAYSSKRYAIPFDIHPRISKLGFDFIDDIIWAKPGPSAKNRNGGFYQHRKPLGYKPNMVIEYVMVYRKHTNKLIDWNIQQIPNDILEQSKIKGTYDMTNLWQIGPSSDKSHPAPFPKKLVENIIKFYSYKNDLVLDPFAGRGTVGEVCKQLDRNYFLVDNKKEYVDLMEKRILKLDKKLLKIGNILK